MQFPGEQLVIKMWETVAEKGVAGLLKPWQIRREGLAYAEVKRQELLLIAQAQEDVKRITERCATYSVANGLRLSYQESEPSIEGNALQSTDDHVRESQIKEQLRKDINLTKTLGFAEQVLADDPSQPSEESVDDDWLYRWRDCAAEVSNESLQVLWGRLIANEVKSPGSFSLRTLEFLKNISSEEAKLAAKILRFAVVDAIFNCSNDNLLKYGVQLHELLEVQSLGLISGVNSLGLNFKLSSRTEAEYRNYVIYHDRVIQIDHADATRSVELPAYILTPLGRQILALAPVDPDREYFEDVAKHIKSRGFDVRLGKATPIGGGQFRLSDMLPVAS